jgi:uncharacterized protein YndB with AHSA1/START domain
MSERRVDHGTFVIERQYEVTPARFFAAWMRPEAKAVWFACHDDWVPSGYQLDFRVGGAERLEVRTPAGSLHRYEGRFLEILPDERILWSYEMLVDGVRISASLATLEVRASRGRTAKAPATAMRFTEQVALLDGHGDLAEREEGTRVQLDNLAAMLQREAAS